MPRRRVVHATAALPLAFSLLVSGGACSSAQSSGVQSEGGDAPAAAGASASGGSTSAGNAGASHQAGSATGGSNAEAGAGAGGAAGGSAGSSGQSGAAGAASVGGASNAECDVGCIQLCEAGLCNCACPTTGLKCWGNISQDEVSFSSACSGDDDCFGAEHYTGCCRVAVVGLNAQRQDAFAQWESETCQSPPTCGCAIDTLTTDDGKMIGRDATYAARCVAGTCETWVP